MIQMEAMQEFQQSGPQPPHLPQLRWPQLHPKPSSSSSSFMHDGGLK